MIIWLRAICAGLVLALVAAPAAAQEQPVPTDQSVPPAPPPDAQLPPPPMPPPFPPMPSSRPSHRWVSIGNHARPHATRAHHARTHNARIRHHRRSSARHRTINPVAETMRWCASMSYRQMLRHGVCRGMVHAYHHAITERHRQKHKVHRVRHHKTASHRAHRHRR